MGPIASNAAPPGGDASLLAVIARPLLCGLAVVAGQMVMVAAGAADLRTLNALLWYTY